MFLAPVAWVTQLSHINIIVCFSLVKLHYITTNLIFHRWKIVAPKYANKKLLAPSQGQKSNVPVICHSRKVRKFAQKFPIRGMQYLQ